MSSRLNDLTNIKIYLRMKNYNLIYVHIFMCLFIYVHIAIQKKSQHPYKLYCSEYRVSLRSLSCIASHQRRRKGVKSSSRNIGMQVK